MKLQLTVLSAAFVCALQITAQPGGGFPGFGGVQVQNNIETSQEWKDVNYVGDNNAYHTCDIYLPKQVKNSYPVVVHIYGSAWFSNSGKGMADIGTIVKALLDDGYAVVCPNHRSSMDAKWPAQIHDIKAVVRFVRGEAKKYKFDTSFIAVSGFSSGGHLASITAATSGTKTDTIGSEVIDLEGSLGQYTSQSSAVDAACVWSGPIDFTVSFAGDNAPENVLIGEDRNVAADKYRSLSTTTYIDKNDPPTIVFHGKQDNIVPYTQGETLYGKLKEAGVKTELTLEPEGGHGMGMYSEANLKKMTDFLDDVREHSSKR